MNLFLRRRWYSSRNQNTCQPNRVIWNKMNEYSTDIECRRCTQSSLCLVFHWIDLTGCAIVIGNGISKPSLFSINHKWKLITYQDYNRSTFVFDIKFSIYISIYFRLKFITISKSSQFYTMNDCIVSLRKTIEKLEATIDELKMDINKLQSENQVLTTKLIEMSSNTNESSPPSSKRKSLINIFLWSSFESCNFQFNEEIKKWK